jgi:hypothetical protein
MKKIYLIKFFIFFNLSLFSLKPVLRPFEFVDPEFPDSKGDLIDRGLSSLSYKDISLRTIDDFFAIFKRYNDSIHNLSEKGKLSSDSFDEKSSERNYLKNEYFLNKTLNEVERVKIKDKHKKITEQLKALRKSVGEFKVLLMEESEEFRRFILNIVDLIIQNRMDEIAKDEIPFESLREGNSYIKSDILNENEKIIVIGDIHGNLQDLTAILYDLINNKDILKKNFKLRPANKIIFLGDIVDRGKDSLKCVLLLMILKHSNPENIVFLRGNHEDLLGNSSFDFNVDLRRFLGVEAVYKFDRYFKTLPCVQFFKTLDDHILIFNHAGWSSGFYTENKIKALFSPRKYTKSRNILINDDLLRKFTWNDIDFNSEDEFADYSSRGRGISVYSAPRVLDDLDSLSKGRCKISKFCGHMHGVPKKVFSENPNPLKHTDGFMRFGDDFYNIYIVISAAIDVYGANGYILRESIKYFPSYLMIDVQDGRVKSVDAYVKRFNDEKFIVADIPNAKDVDLVIED